MTGLPDDADRTNRERSAAEVDAEFASIVSGISTEMTWSSTAEELDSAATSGTGPPAAAAAAAQRAESAGGADRADGADGAPGADAESNPASDERERRRAQRRAQRAEEVADFEAGQAEAEAELQADDAHFVPPEPPPLPKPKQRTVVALLFMAIGVILLVRPSLLEVAPDVVLVLGIGCLVGGFAMLIHGLRPRAADPDDADGWDDGARL